MYETKAKQWTKEKALKNSLILSVSINKLITSTRTTVLQLGYHHTCLFYCRFLVLKHLVGNSARSMATIVFFPHVFSHTSGNLTMATCLCLSVVWSLNW